MIINQLSLINRQEFLDFLYSVDLEFTPPLSNKISFNEYYDKIMEVGNVCCYYANNKVIGLVIFYDNQDIAQITLVAVDPKYRGKGIASQIIKSVLNEINKPTRIITWESNIRAIYLYKKLGFEITNINLNKYNINELIMDKK
ncbi:GNAT family N-acetyltransferase [Photobacterium toruni]|uniref:GNAT family N-acetyltransferase n=1 Tax=Photobacterium toruni TaxID=1935446 RepID=UPI00210FB9DD|nr:GNAT family N-acetyltransferase [Photobacterium toruni]